MIRRLNADDCLNNYSPRSYDPHPDSLPGPTRTTGRSLISPINIQGISVGLNQIVRVASRLICEPGMTDRKYELACWVEMSKKNRDFGSRHG